MRIKERKRRHAVAKPGRFGAIFTALLARFFAPQPLRPPKRPRRRASWVVPGRASVARPRGRMPIRADRHKLVGIQYLRALAATGVVLFHSAYKCGFTLEQGSAGVDLFFVISGFLMMTITDADTRPRMFLKDRLLRVVPIYWIATAVTILSSLANASSVPLRAWHTIASFLFIPAYSPLADRVWPVLLQGWSLSDEMFFYMLVASALLLPRRLQMIALTVVIGGLVAIGQSMKTHDPILVAWTDPIFLEFLFGGWLAVLWRRYPAWPPLLGWPLILAGVVAFGVGIVLGTPSRAIGYGLPGLLLVAGTLCRERQAGGVRNIRPARLAGDASYSIYLWHTFAVSVAVGAAIDFNIDVNIAFWICVAAGIVAGVVLYLALEAPLLTAMRRRRWRHGAPIPGGV